MQMPREAAARDFVTSAAKTPRPMRRPWTAKKSCGSWPKRMERETCEVNKNPRTEKWPAVFRGPSFHANFYCCGGWSEDAGGGVESPEESGEFAAGLGRGVCFFGK